MSLGVLFFLLLANTIKFPFCFSGDCQFIGFPALLKLNPVPAALILLIILAAAFWLRFNYKYAKGGSDLPRKIIKIEDIRFENLAFLATYLIPLIAFDPTKIRGSVMLVLVLLVIGWIFINTNTFYQNPALAILGYKLYRVDTETTKGRIIITRDELEIDDYIYPRQISKNLDFAMRDRNDK